jgi:hypothetical protein
MAGSPGERTPPRHALPLDELGRVVNTQGPREAPRIIKDDAVCARHRSKSPEPQGSVSQPLREALNYSSPFL